MFNILTQKFGICAIDRDKVGGVNLCHAFSRRGVYICVKM